MNLKLKMNLNCDWTLFCQCTVPFMIFDFYVH